MVRLLANYLLSQSTKRTAKIVGKGSGEGWEERRREGEKGENDVAKGQARVDIQKHNVPHEEKLPQQEVDVHMLDRVLQSRAPPPPPLPPETPTNGNRVKPFAVFGKQG